MNLLFRFFHFWLLNFNFFFFYWIFYFGFFNFWFNCTLTRFDLLLQLIRHWRISQNCRVFIIRWFFKVQVRFVVNLRRMRLLFSWHRGWNSRFFLPCFLNTLGFVRNWTLQNMSWWSLMVFVLARVWFLLFSFFFLNSQVFVRFFIMESTLIGIDCSRWSVGSIRSVFRIFVLFVF